MGVAGVVAFAMLAVGLTVPASATLATFVSDTFAGTKVGQFEYHGRWEHVHVLRDGRFFGTSSRTSTSGASVTLQFFGEAVRLYGVRGPGGGYGLVRIDGKPPTRIEFYAARKIPRSVVFTSPLLPRAQHALTIEAMGASGEPGHRGAYINVTGAVYQ